MGQHKGGAMAKKRKVDSAAYKSQVALAAHKGDKTINELAGHYSGPRKLDHRLSYSDGPAQGGSDGEEAEGRLGCLQVSGRTGRSQGGQDDQRVGRAL